MEGRIAGKSGLALDANLMHEDELGGCFIVDVGKGVSGRVEMRRENGARLAALLDVIVGNGSRNNGHEPGRRGSVGMRGKGIRVSIYLQPLSIVVKLAPRDKVAL